MANWYWGGTTQSKKASERRLNFNKTQGSAPRLKQSQHRKERKLAKVDPRDYQGVTRGESD